jgi:Ca2+-binding EF-hand superfamily protein
MNKLVVTVLTMACALSLTVSAAEGKQKLTDEQKALRKELLEKYDTNKDGKLDKEERAKMSKEDKQKAEKAGLGHKKVKKDESRQ